MGFSFWGSPDSAFLLPSGWPGGHLEVLMVPAAEHPSRLPQRWAKAPRGAGQPGDANSLPSGQRGADDSCQPGGPSGELRSSLAIPAVQQPVWQAAEDSASLKAMGIHLPAWQLWAAEKPRLPAPSGWSWEADHPPGHCQELQHAWQGLDHPKHCLGHCHISGNQPREEGPLPIKKSQFSRFQLQSYP